VKTITSDGLRTSDPSQAEAVRSIYADDPDFRELLKYFVDVAAERRGELIAAYEADDLSLLTSIAHQLKGAGGGYGFDGLSEAAQTLESICKNERSGEIREGVEAIVRYLDRITL